MKNRILVVEDDDLMQSMLKDAMSGCEYNVSFTASGLRGLEQFEKNDFDLVLLDMKLPGMDGISLLKKMKELSPDTIVIMMTGYGTIETAVEAMRNGAYDYITKPFLADELVFVIKKAFEFQRLKQENILLKEELGDRYSLGNMIGKSKSIREVFRLIEVVTPRDSTVLIHGESGTGKELIAEALHHLSPRKNHPVVKVSCAALPETILESELFGHEKGAFTDAARRKIGRIELAHRGTLFLDDVDDMSHSIQVKLLRVLQEREFERVGGIETIKVDVRLITASKIDLKDAVEDGSFREDLYYRLHVVPIHAPPLRDRKEDISLLVNHFVNKYGTKMNRKPKVHTDALEKMMKYHWPGNIRELENLIERLIAVSVSDDITADDLPFEVTDKRIWAPEALKHVVHKTEAEHIRKVLELTGGKKREAAKILGITPKTLWQKSKAYRIG